MNSRDKAITIARLADEHKATNIRVLDVGGVCNFADLFVIATCASPPQLRALGQRTQRRLRELGERPISVVGLDTTTWVVADYGDVVAHFLSAEARDYYRIDRLWRDGTLVEWMERAG